MLLTHVITSVHAYTYISDVRLENAGALVVRSRLIEWC